MLTSILTWVIPWSFLGKLIPMARLFWLIMTCVTLAAAQSAGPDAGIQFDVASIKLNSTGDRGVRIGGPPGTLRAQNAWVRFLIQTAWNVKDFQITGGPAWAASDRYDIDAKTSDRAKFGQTRELLQALLEERFHLAVHRETRELPVLLLTIAKNGIRFEVSKEGGCTTPTPGTPATPPAPGSSSQASCGSVRTSPRGIDGRAISMEQITTALSNILQRPVIDKTGLTGTFDVHAEWIADESTPGPMAGLAQPPTPSDGSGPTVFTALQNQLGLKVESGRGPVEMLVVDRLDRPSPN